MFALLRLHFMQGLCRPVCFVMSFSLLASHSYGGDDHDHPSPHIEMAQGQQLDEHDHDKQDHDEHSEDEHGHEDDGHSDSVIIDAHTAKQSGITTAKAHSGTIAKTHRVFGKVANDPSQISHIGARFDGTIIQVNASVGDTVKKGMKLARIESNQSLHPYYVNAPFDGIIIERHANPGELTQDQPLFTLFNDNILWAEFKIFPNQMLAVKQGQDVIIDNEVFRIAHIIPNTSGGPYELARVRLDNHDHGWRAGVTVKGDVVTQSKTVALRIPNQAMQQVEGNTVVFIKQGDEYTASPITLGLQDHQFSEVLTGLSKDDEYVVKNSYLIKADLEKAGAEHVH